MGFPYGSGVKKLPAMQETWVWSLGWEDPLEKCKAPVFWPGEFHGLYRFMGSQTVGHNLATCICTSLTFNVKGSIIQKNFTMPECKSKMLKKHLIYSYFKGKKITMSEKNV